MRIAVIGAGPAGLTSAKQALAAGHDVVVHEKHADVGGIWNPAAGGAYDSVRMQTSRLAFPYSDFPPATPTDFPSLAEVHGYLREYAEHFGVLPVTRFGSEVTRVAKVDGRWRVGDEDFDAVMVATGELWRPRLPPGTPPGTLTAKDYRRPEPFRGQRVLVVGGGVSGADIAGELTGVAASVDWSVRRKQLFLPRYCGEFYNDALFSYAGRVAVEDMPYGEYLAWLEELMPAYMRTYRATGLLPDDGFHGAVHVNEKIIPLVDQGAVRARPAFAAFTADGAVEFADGRVERYDTVILCLGYQMPDYGFIDGLRREDLYEHHLHRIDPTLAVINTPVDTEAFGTACPYFEAIAGWVLAVWAGTAPLPDVRERSRWCAEHMGALHRRRYLDCWLETVRFRLLSGALPDPATDFADYWTAMASAVSPHNLVWPSPRPAAHDSAVDVADVRRRVLAGLPEGVRDALLADAQITPADHAAAALVPRERVLDAWLPYRQHPRVEARR
ncbi:NAD(P)/FAD-dependent oxidoreductase [Actinokineospora sp. UTMC 2448]|uniref:flavin-containing monooxygenase n=1 Tax=Actinokineospora sp. UTMC 2448 TaxID=2268449 RepID=UPI00216452BA|nr:NAD(P)-binding domain-containing protein [Actinokineospora sp. UTMC 2448]UVS82501.1 putative oxidoreductase CzcO [Actinokineospora sp. UTMC 2448]